jgi:uncharacterized membrane protein
VRRLRTVIAGVFPFLIVGVFAVVGWASEQAGTGEKSFTLEDITVVARLDRRGVLHVRERVTYDFDGTFTVGTRDFDSGPWEIQDIEAFEGERRLPELVNTPTLFEWDISPASGTHTYELRYEVHDAVIAWPDVVELNWQWVGRDVPSSVDHHEVALRVPGDEVRGWAHGPLNGTIDVDGPNVHTEVDDLPANTFLETRVIAPRDEFRPGLPPGRVGQETLREDAFDTCDVVRDALLAANPDRTDRQLERQLEDVPSCQADPVAPVQTAPQEQRIIDEETALAEQANRDRAAFEREQQEKEDRERALSIASPFVIVLGLLLAFLIWRRWGKEPELAAEVDYWREVPDDPPGVAQAILSWGYVDTDAFSATVVDLAQRGHLTIEEIEKDHRFTDAGKPRDELKEHERMAMTRLFSNGSPTTQKELTKWAKAHRTEASKWMESFKRAVTKSYNARGYQVKGQTLAYLLYVLVVLAVAGFGVVAWVNDAAIPGAVCCGVALVILLNIGLMRRRTPKGAQRHAEWAGLKRFLKDFSQLQDAPSGHLALYERYLVAAVALDVADELVDALRVRMPEVANDPTFASWYVGSRVGGVGSFSSIGDFSSGFSSATASSFRAPSSSGSSGGGFSGGFSGGGGGGGGGGGFGAR